MLYKKVMKKSYVKKYNFNARNLLHFVTCVIETVTLLDTTGYCWGTHYHRQIYWHQQLLTIA